MNARRTIHTGLAVTLLLAGFSAAAWADKEKERGRGRGEDSRGGERTIRVDRPAVEHRGNEGPFRVGPIPRGGDRAIHVESPYRGRDPRGIVIEGGRRHIPAETHSHYQQRGWAIDRRHNHNHYYPPRGHVVHTLPAHHHTVHFHNVPYHFHGGVWYRSYNSRFVVAIPPVGIRIRVLPEFYTTIWFGGIPYYYAGGVYYLWEPQERIYVVTKPPSEIASLNDQAPASGDQLYIYPKQGQSDEQQAKDRYDCHRWGVSQTGYDPTAASLNLSVSEQASKRLDYNRAMKACLEGRGYSVQ